MFTPRRLPLTAGIVCVVSAGTSDRPVGKKQAYLSFGGLAVAAGIALALAPASAPGVAFVCFFFLGIGLWGVNTLMWTLEADIVEYGEWKTGIRTQGITYALFSFTRKTPCRVVHRAHGPESETSRGDGRRAMDKFGAMVRIGDPIDHKTQKQVAGVLRLHIETGCWSSTRQRNVRPGMPVIASQIGAGQGRFLVGVFTGEPMAVPWEKSPEHAEHVGHGVRWIDAVFVGDADLIAGAKGRTLKWLSAAEFNDAWGRLAVQDAIQ